MLQYLHLHRVINRIVCLSAVFLVSCNALPNAGGPPINSQQTLPSAEMRFEYQGKRINALQLADFLIQGAQSQQGQQKGGQNNSGGSNASNGRKWYEHPRHGDWKKTPELLINDVKLTANNASIMGPTATTAIEPDYAGKVIELTLTGTFKEAKKDLLLKNFLFTLEPPLVQQTFVGKEPKDRVLLDESILLEPVLVSGAEIKVKLNTQSVPDLYLKGLHKISVEHGNWYTDVLIRVGEPAPVENLQPQIDSVEILRDDKGLAQHLKLTGQNFMIYPKFSYALIDGEFGFGYQTEVTADGQFETIVHVPNPSTFDQKAEHVVIMATPFGVRFKGFS